jgi:hypothetical protein
MRKGNSLAPGGSFGKAGTIETTIPGGNRELVWTKIEEPTPEHI